MSDDTGMVKELARAQGDVDDLKSIETPHNERYKTFWFGYSKTTEVMVMAVVATTPHNVVWNQLVPNDGDEWYWYAPMEQGSYKISVLGISAADRGVADFYVNGVEIASKDWYAAPAVHDEEWTFNWNPTQTRLHEFKIVVDGKNGLSTNFHLVLSSIVIYRV